MPKEQIILMVGTPISGFEIIGPFITEEDAEDYGERKYEDKEFWVITMMAPL